MVTVDPASGLQIGNSAGEITALHGDQSQAVVGSAVNGIMS
jgi:hypothetical protein